MTTLYYESSLSHHGIKGQKWGVRRYQNEDGSLTTRGQKHYDKEQNKMATIKAKRYARGKKLYEKGMDAKSISERNQIIKDSVNLGASTVRTLLLVSGLSATPVTAVSIASVSVGTMAYNMIQKRRTQNQIDAYNEYMSSIKKR